MRAIMARLRGPRLSAGDRVDLAMVPHRARPFAADLQAVVDLDFEDPRPYSDAVYEAFDQCVKLGLDVNPAPEYDAADLIRYAYAQGWLACEKRLAAPNMADLIDLALNTTHAVTEQRSGESLNRWTVRAVQQVVAYGVKSEPH